MADDLEATRTLAYQGIALQGYLDLEKEIKFMKKLMENNDGAGKSQD